MQVDTTPQRNVRELVEKLAQEEGPPPVPLKKLHKVSVDIFFLCIHVYVCGHASRGQNFVANIFCAIDSQNFELCMP